MLFAAPTLEIPIILDPIKSIDPNVFVPIPVPDSFDAKVFFKTFMSWSLVNLLVGVNIKVFLPESSTFALNSPSNSFVYAVYFSNKTESRVVVCNTNSVIWVSYVSGSTIWIVYLTCVSIVSISSISTKGSSNPLLENLPLISSWIKTLFVLHSV